MFGSMPAPLMSLPISSTMRMSTSSTGSDGISAFASSRSSRSRRSIEAAGTASMSAVLCCASSTSANPPRIGSAPSITSHIDSRTRECGVSIAALWKERAPSTFPPPTISDWSKTILQIALERRMRLRREQRRICGRPRPHWRRRTRAVRSEFCRPALCGARSGSARRCAGGSPKSTSLSLALARTAAVATHRRNEERPRPTLAKTADYLEDRRRDVRNTSAPDEHGDRAIGERLRPLHRRQGRANGTGHVGKRACREVLNNLGHQRELDRFDVTR